MNPHIFQTCVFPETLRLNDNFFDGSFPDAFAQYEQLDFFDISNTFVTGTLPVSIFSIDNIRIVYMSNCSFTGSLPSEYSNPLLLRDLYLDGNLLSGTVPDILPGQLEQLSEFLLQDNFFIGSVPQSVCDLKSIGRLDDLFADCGGMTPEIECDFPFCCSRCFTQE